MLEGPRISERKQLCLHPAEWGRDFKISPVHERIKDKIKDARCRRCVYDKICEGIYRTYARHRGLDELKPLKK
jgi:hypothetical protein